MKPRAWAGLLIVGVSLATVQAPLGTVLTSEDLETDFLFRRPFPAEGQTWTALAGGPGSAALTRASVRWDTGLDAGDSVFTLSVEPEHPTLLIGGVPQLRIVPVVVATHGLEPLTSDSPTHEVDLAQSAYALTLDSSDPTLCDATITLSEGDRSQSLYRPEQPFACDEPHFTIEWAGDLDGDGRLDLVATLSPKYSYYPRRLWLSSAAAEGELVGLVAEYEGGD